MVAAALQRTPGNCHNQRPNIAIPTAAAQKQQHVTRDGQNGQTPNRKIRATPSIAIAIAVLGTLVSP
jgi:hypothetical protein